MAKRYGWLLLILLAATALRLAFLSDIPPGLTHDEADHGLDAWGVVNGVRPVYFTVGYGREPLYDYATAGLMTILGPSFLAGRLVSAFFSLILIAGSYAWVNRVFDRRTALLTAAGIAVSFWAVMTGRQALRSITLPALFVLAVYFFWKALDISGAGAWRLGASPKKSNTNQMDAGPAANSWTQRLATSPNTYFVLSGLLLGVTFYAYIPARILWVIFPLVLLYLLFSNRSLFTTVWRGVALMMVVAGAIALPLFVFLSTNPTAETRIEQLSDPLTEVADGNFEPLLSSFAEGLRLIAIEGDSQWRYNISGRPLLPAVVAILFVVGVALVLWWIVRGWRDQKHKRRSTAAFFALIWLIVGLSPAFITGSELSTTQAIGALPIIFVFPAIVLAQAMNTQRFGKGLATLAKVLTALLFAALFIQTARAYFITWANEPEVRVQYETTLVSAIDYLNEFGQGATSISTTTPNQFHSPAVGTLTLDNTAVQLRYFNGHHSLLLPNQESGTVIFTGFAPLNPLLEPYFEGTYQKELPLRDSDLDQPLTVYTVDGPATLSGWMEEYDGQITEPTDVSLPVSFDDIADLVGYELLTPSVHPGEEVQLVTLWQVNTPIDGAVFFTHLLGHDGLPIAQADRLDASGNYWMEGDLVVQLHQFRVPESTPAAGYPLIVGIYTQGDLDRLPVLVDGTATQDHLFLTELAVNP